MVKLAGEEMNHIYKSSFKQGCIDESGDSTTDVDIDVGDTEAYFKKELTLYEKSLALTNDLKRLPIVRDIETIIDMPNPITEITASGRADLSIEIFGFNGKVDFDISSVEQYIESEDLIYYRKKNINFNNATAANITAVTEFDEGGWIPKASSILGRNKMTFIAKLQTVGAVATSTLIVNDIIAITEVDWQNVNKKEIEQYIMEDYFRDDNV